MIKASMEGVLRAVGLFLAQGADINYHGPEMGRRTALHAASHEGQLAVVLAVGCHGAVGCELSRGLPCWLCLLM